jgi:hypothetical protein
MGKEKANLNAIRFCVILVSILFFSPVGTYSQDSVRFGTLIGAYGNKNGIAVVTDSRLATLDNNKQPVLLPRPGQKLLRLDDHTVVAVAGVEFIPVQTMESLNADTLGVIQSLRAGITGKPTFDQLLNEISAVLRFYLTTLTEIKIQTGLSADEIYSPVEVILAGYDLDGSAKIGKVKIQYVPVHQTAKPDSFIAIEVLHKSDSVGDDFVYETGGINDTAEQRLSTPLKRVYNPPALEKYWSALQNHTRKDLTIENLAQLGDSLENETHGKTELVGGLSQIAILEAGHVRSVEPANLFDPLRIPFAISVFKDSSLSGGRVLVARHGGNSVVFYDTVNFSGETSTTAKFPVASLTLDGNIFVHCTFTNVNLYYDGEQAYFDPSNVFSNSHFMFGPHVPAALQNYYLQLVGQTR